MPPQVNGAAQAAAPRWLTIEELAERCKVPVATVRWWRNRGGGPSSVKMGRFVRYRVEDVERWEAGLPERGDKALA